MCLIEELTHSVLQAIARPPLLVRFAPTVYLRYSVPMKKMLILVCLALISCQTNASHLPGPHQLPGQVLGSIIENGRYSSRRNRVRASIQPHVDFILSEADKGGGPTFNLTCKTARIGATRCSELARQISKDSHIYKTGHFAEKVEKLTVAFMVYAD